MSLTPSSTVAVPDVAENTGELAVNAAPTLDELVEQDLLVEDVSIDGMCGVY